MGPRLGVVLALVAGSLRLSAQEDPRRLPPAEATAVVVDVVVRDGKGRPATDLTAADFEVLEDGVPQVVERFAPPAAVVEADRALPLPAPVEPEGAPRSTPGAPPAPRGPSLIAFVLDRLSTEGRLAAERALRDHLRERQEGDVAGVFSLEDTLVVLQDFTADPALLQAAVDALASRVAHAGSPRIDQARALTGTRLAANAARATLLATARPSNAAQGVARAQSQVLAAQLSMTQAAADAFDHLERDQHGFVTANALTAIVDALRPAPGRKAVVLFSEGLFRTEANQQRFLAAVHAANRASVSVYAVEAAGLASRSYESLTREEIVSAGNLSLARQAAGEDLGGGSWTRGMESVEDSVRFHPRASLEWISESTGGVFVRDTNDLSGALRGIGSDLRSYYLLGYTPRNETFDGRFRKIAVKVRRKGLQVRARSGYFAVRSAGPVLAHVAPALALLEAGKRPKAVPVYAAAWPFPSGAGAVRVPVAVSVPAAALVRLGSTGKRGPLDLTLLARLLDADGRPVEAMSRRFLFDPRGEAKGVDLCFLRDAWLTPGRYTLEAVAYEAQGSRAGVATTELEVGPGTRPLDRPQLILVRGALPAADAPADLETGHPFRFGDVILQPLAGEPVPEEPPRPLVFQLATAGSSPAALPEATVGVWQGETRIGQGTVSWGAPDPEGWQRYVAEAPMGTLRPGRYELRVRLRDASGERVLRAPFEVTR